MKMTCVFFEAALTGLFMPLPRFFEGGDWLALIVKINSSFFSIYTCIMFFVVTSLADIRKPIMVQADFWIIYICRSQQYLVMHDVPWPLVTMLTKSAVYADPLGDITIPASLPSS